MRWKMAALIVPVLLIGCNMVVSDRPWFSETDAAGAPALRDGLWVMLEDADCRFDDSLPADQWPECAGALTVEGNRLTSREWDQPEAGGPRTLSSTDRAEIVLAAGNPRIMQFRSLGKAGDNGKEDSGWFYVGIRPTAQDASGRITAFNRWLVQCGPPPPPGGRYVTRHPFRGLTVMGSDCTATSLAALRNAAARSERLRNSKGQIDTPPAHWVREGNI